MTPTREPVMELSREEIEGVICDAIRDAKRLRADLKLAMEYAGHKRSCLFGVQTDTFTEMPPHPCDCGYTALRERLVSESLI